MQNKFKIDPPPYLKLFTAASVFAVVAGWIAVESQAFLQFPPIVYYGLAVLIFGTAVSSRAAVLAVIGKLNDFAAVRSLFVMVGLALYGMLFGSTFIQLLALS